jgi:UDP-N-acetylglucosamine:LPS N-acetylglucosamine transferase
LLEDGEARRAMSQASRALGKPNAHVEIADAIEALAR